MIRDTRSGPHRYPQSPPKPMPHAPQTNSGLVAWPQFSFSEDFRQFVIDTRGNFAKLIIIRGGSDPVTTEMTHCRKSSARLCSPWLSAGSSLGTILASGVVRGAACFSVDVHYQTLILPVPDRFSPRPMPAALLDGYQWSSWVTLRHSVWWPRHRTIPSARVRIVGTPAWLEKVYAIVE